MIGTLGIWEMMALLVLALVIFGPRRLPEIGRSLGKAVGAFRKASFDFRDTLEREVAMEKNAEAPRANPGPPRFPPPYDTAPTQQPDSGAEMKSASEKEASAEQTGPSAEETPEPTEPRA